MGNVLCLIGAFIIILGWVLIQFLVKPENIKKNVYGVLDNYQDEEILSDEDWEKCTGYMQRPLDRIKMCFKIIKLGSIIMMLGALVGFIGIWV